MGYAVLHLDKSPGNESAMTDHIERKVIHPNVDPERIHLNRELIEFPEGVNNRTEAIQHRLKTAGLTRQIGKNQVQVIRIMLSGSPEDMERIQQEGKLDEWCRDNINWLKKTFGAENVVAATLHMDETTPHIHASVVPIVQGERRKKESKKKKQEQEQTDKLKRKYKKKDPSRVRLCCDDVMAKAKLIEYQDSYGKAMNKYGLIRGEKGSDARHITLTEFYRNQAIESRNLQINIEKLLAVEDAKRQSIEELKRQEQEAKLKSKQAEEQKQQKESELKKTEENLNQVKRELKTEKFKNSAAEAGSVFMDGISSAFGTSKVKRQQQEIENLKHEKYELEATVEGLTKTIQQERSQHQQEKTQLNQKIFSFQEEIKKIHELFPKVKELFRMEKILKALNFSDSLIELILKMEPVGFKGKIFSPEHQSSFTTEHSVTEIKTDPKDDNKLELHIDDKPYTNWFKEKQNQFLESLGYKQKQQPEVGKNKRIRR